MKFELPKLEYNYDALEPHIDALTMEIHHSRHHQAYTNNFNAALEGVAGLEGLSAQEIIVQVDKLVPADKKQAVINNGGGYINHALFFEILGQNNSKPSSQLAQAIDEAFGSFDQFKEAFTVAATTQFGSGWAWLVVDNGKLSIVKTGNQDSPVSNNQVPILALDVWEHAYYLNYQNKRPDYIANFFNVINWDVVSKKYQDAL
ncbi:MAG: superoxide dismutase [Bacilli bacterium]